MILRRPSARALIASEPAVEEQSWGGGGEPAGGDPKAKL